MKVLCSPALIEMSPSSSKGKVREGQERQLTRGRFFNRIQNGNVSGHSCFACPTCTPQGCPFQQGCVGVRTQHASFLSSLGRMETGYCLEALLPLKDKARNKTKACSVMKAGFESRLEALLWRIQWGKDGIQRLQPHNYKPVLVFSFQILLPCPMRRQVHTEHYKENARRQALS